MYIAVGVSCDFCIYCKSFVLGNLTYGKLLNIDYQWNIMF